MGKPEETFAGTGPSHVPEYYDAATSYTYEPTPSSQPYGAAPSFSPSPDTISPQSEHCIFPKDIVFYRAEYMSLIVGPQFELNKPHPPPLFWVSIHMDNRLTNKSEIPQVRLHYGPDATYPVIGDVRFRFTLASDITIKASSEISSCSNTQTAASGIKFEFTTSGVLTTDVHTFHYPVPSKDGYSTVEEKFEWRHRGDPEVKVLATENVPGQNYSQETRGLKLVRVSTGEVLVAFAGGRHQRTLNPRRIAGKVRFLRDLFELDRERSQEFRLLAVMSILSIFERS
jgi:hypothetical protein